VLASSDCLLRHDDVVTSSCYIVTWSRGPCDTIKAMDAKPLPTLPSDLTLLVRRVAHDQWVCS